MDHRCMSERCSLDLSTITTDHLRLARSWIVDCDFPDADETYVESLTGSAVVHGVDRHYDGGWTQFVKDVTP